MDLQPVCVKSRRQGPFFVDWDNPSIQQVFDQFDERFYDPLVERPQEVEFGAA